MLPLSEAAQSGLVQYSLDQHLGCDCGCFTVTPVSKIKQINSIKTGTTVKTSNSQNSFFLEKEVRVCLKKNGASCIYLHITLKRLSFVDKSTDCSVSSTTLRELYHWFWTKTSMICSFWNSSQSLKMKTQTIGY